MSPKRKPEANPRPQCLDRTAEALAALRAINLDPTLQRARAAHGVLRRHCEIGCGARTCKAIRSAVLAMYRWFAEQDRDAGGSGAALRVWNQVHYH